MDLLNNNGAKIAVEIESIAQETTRFVEHQLKRIYNLINTDGRQSEVLAAFGDKAVFALQSYAAFKSALDVASPENEAEPTNLSVFQPQPDGTAIYVPPVVPNE